MNNNNVVNNIQLKLQAALAALTIYFALHFHRAAKMTVPGTTNCLLSDPSKMPGLSWGLPALRACPRKAGTICGACYACKGRYVMPCVANAQDARFKWTVQSMRTQEGFEAWVLHMASAIYKQEYFRIHDSGDFFNLRYIEAWIEVCKLCPATKFWAPSRAYQGGVMGLLPVFDPILNALRKLAALPNVTVRPSALNFGDLPPVVSGLHAGSTADADSLNVYQCPARAKYDGHCGPCRHCWDAKNEPVNYPKH
jgi:hypothetical protein